MRKYQQHPWISRSETLRLILSRSRFKPRVEMLPVREALGRITAQETLAINTLPNCPTSTLDGIAIKAANIVKGKLVTDHWQEGVDYVFSNTGVGIPNGYDTVVLIEDVEFDEKGKLKIASIPTPGQNVQPAGKKMKAGDVLIPAHYCLGPSELGLLTAGGITEIAVLEKPRVAILPTGNELVPVGESVPRGKNVEYNGIMMEAQIKTMGGDPRLYPITRDNPEDLATVIKDALDWADIVILNGGSSKGSDDRALDVLATIGEILVYEVDYGPGKHTSMTIAGTKPIVGTVGPTVGAEYAVEWYVWPLLGECLFQPTSEPGRVQVKLREDIPSSTIGFYTRLKLEQVDGVYWAKQIKGFMPLASHMLAQAVLYIPTDVKCYRAGDLVEVELRYPR